MDNNRIVVLNSNGTASTTYDNIGVSEPFGITFSSTGGFLVADGDNNRIVILNSSGVSIGSYDGVPSVEGTDYPGQNDSVTIDTGSIILSEDQNIGSLILDAGGTLDLNGHILNVYGSYSNTGGTLILNGGSIHIVSTSTSHRSSTSDTGSTTQSLSSSTDPTVIEIPEDKTTSTSTNDKKESTTTLALIKEPPKNNLPEKTKEDLVPSNPEILSIPEDNKGDQTVTKDKNEFPTVVPETGTISNLKEIVTSSYDAVKSVVEDSYKNISEVINSKNVSIIVKSIETVGIVMGATISVSAIAFANPATFSEVWMIPGRLFGLLMGALGIRKKNRPWGTVYDSVTKRPLDPAYVMLIDKATGKEVASAITDLDGRYGFLTVPGTYTIVPKKTNYNFPSKKMEGKVFDEVYNDLYFGVDITVSMEGEVITKNIPMDPQNFDWNEFTKNRMNVNTFLKKKDVVIAEISKVVFILGTIVSIIAVIFAPAPYNILIAVLYVGAYVFRYKIIKIKKAGVLKEKNENIPLSFAIVEIYQEGIETPLTKKIADKYGEYYALVPKGNYYLKIYKKNLDEGYTAIEKTGVMTVDNGVINSDIMIG